MTFNKSPISWQSKRQIFTAQSSLESEYAAASENGKEVVWITRFFNEIGKTYIQPVPIYMDSQTAIRLAENPELHQRSKHIDVRHHYIRELVEKEKVVLKHLPDVEQPADLLTKSIAATPFEEKRRKMGMCNPPVKGERERE